MWFNVPVGLGELVDRLLIARLKRQHIDEFNEPGALAIATRDVEGLEKVLTDNIGPINDMEPFVRVAYGALSIVNRRVWNLETRIRHAPRTESVDRIARQVRMLNDVRSLIRLSLDRNVGNVDTLGKNYGRRADDEETQSDASRGLLLDLDGVLADTEPLKATAHERTVEELGGQLPENFYAGVLGRSQREVATAAMERSGVSAALDRYNAIFERNYVDLIGGGVHPVTGSPELVTRARELGLRTCVITSSSNALAAAVLASIGMDINSFDLVMSADDSLRHKPSSEPYLSLLKALWIERGSTLAIEDAAPGVEAAARVGIPVVAVRHPLNRGHDLGAARYVVESLADDRLMRDIYALSAGVGVEA